MVAEAVQEVQELPDGYAFRYAADESTWMNVARFVELERRCCAFLFFTLELEERGSVWLRLTGREGVKEFIATQL